MRSAQAHQAEAQGTADAMLTMVTKSIHMEFIETNTHLQLTRNYQDGILPAAQSSTRISRQLYASGRGDFVRLLESLRTWIEANVAYQEQLYHYAEHWSELERWVGIDLAQAKETLGQSPTQEMHHAY